LSDVAEYHKIVMSIWVVMQYCNTSFDVNFSLLILWKLIRNICTLDTEKQQQLLQKGSSLGHVEVSLTPHIHLHGTVLENGATPPFPV
jgi:hypothetical protein